MKNQKALSFILALTVFMLSFIGSVPCAFAKEYAEEFEACDFPYYLIARGVKDPSFLEKYTNMDTISISDSTITDEYNFSLLNSLSTITFENCEFKITDLIFPESEFSAEITVTFTDCKFSAGDLILPNHITHLTFNNAVYKNLGSISNLNQLDLIHCNLNDLTGLSQLKNLKNLYTEYCNFGSLKGIEALTNLTDLSLSSNTESIKRLETLKNLSSVYFYLPFAKDLSPIQSLENLRTLSIELSGFESYEPLLNLKSQKIEDICVNSSHSEAFTPDVIELLKKYDSNELDDDILEIKEKLIEIKNEVVKDGMSDLEIIRAVTQYVTDNIEYDYKVDFLESKKDREALSLEYNLQKQRYALTGEGVCTNFSVLTASLLTMSGINCYEVLSTTHVWNLIELNGEYYWLDPTYIDTELLGAKLEDCPSYMSQDNEEFIETRMALLIPDSLYKKLHNIPEEDFKDSEPAEAVQAVINEQNQPNKSVPKPLIIAAVAVGVVLIVMVTILIIKKSKKKFSQQNNVDYIDSL